VARALRHENPRCGREQFDRRAGLEWEYGPGSSEIADSIPDVPWHKYKRTLELPNRLLFSNDQWAVTIFRLEPLYEADPEQFEPRLVAGRDRLVAERRCGSSSY